MSEEIENKQFVKLLYDCFSLVGGGGLQTHFHNLHDATYKSVLTIHPVV